MKDSTRKFLEEVHSEFKKGNFENVVYPDIGLSETLEISACDHEEFVELTEAYIEYADRLILGFHHSDQDLYFVKSLRTAAYIREDFWSQIQDLKPFKPFIEFFSEEGDLSSNSLREIYLKGSLSLKKAMAKCLFSLEEF